MNLVEKQLISDLRDAVRRYADEAGPCDHDVNVCVCGLHELVERATMAVDGTKYPGDVKVGDVIRVHDDGPWWLVVARHTSDADDTRELDLSVVEYLKDLETAERRVFSFNPWSTQPIPVQR